MKLFCLPALCDLHIHGAFGVDFMSADETQVRQVSEKLAERGIGFYAPTLLTSSPRLLCEALTRWARILNRIHEKPTNWPMHAALPVGIHLEGPFLQPHYAGAHPKKHLLLPSPFLLSKILKAGGGWIRILTLSPELPHALPAIRRLGKQGVRVQLGHSGASASQALRAFAAGAGGITHLHNAMRAHHRDPGLLAGLWLGRAHAEVITDGLHLHPLLIYELARKYKGRVYGVSDCCSAAHARTQERPCTLGSIAVARRKAAAFVADRSGAPTQTLAGSATLLSEHPERLLRALRKHHPPSADLPNAVLSLFQGLSRQLASKCLGRPLKTRFFCYFEAKTLRFMGTTSLRAFRTSS